MTDYSKEELLAEIKRLEHEVYLAEMAKHYPAFNSSPMTDLEKELQRTIELHKKVHDRREVLFQFAVKEKEKATKKANRMYAVCRWLMVFQWICIAVQVFQIFKILL